MAHPVAGHIGFDVQALKVVAAQPVVTGASSLQSTALGAKTRVVRLCASVACYVAFGANPTAAAASGVYLHAGVPELFVVDPLSKVAAIQFASAGILNIAEMA